MSGDRYSGDDPIRLSLDAARDEYTDGDRFQETIAAAESKWKLFEAAVADALWLLDNPNAGIGRPGTSDDYKGRDERRERLRVFRESYPEYSRDAIAVAKPVYVYSPPIDASENFQIGVTEHGDRVFAIHDFPEVLDRIFAPSALVVVSPGSGLLSGETVYRCDRCSGIGTKDGCDGQGHCVDCGGKMVEAEA